MIVRSKKVNKGPCSCGCSESFFDSWGSLRVYPVFSKLYNKTIFKCRLCNHIIIDRKWYAVKVDIQTKIKQTKPSIEWGPTIKNFLHEIKKKISS